MTRLKSVLRHTLCLLKWINGCAIDIILIYTLKWWYNKYNKMKGA